ncbi:anti-sigma factor [Flavobacterium sp.]|uniref:anti-sigma factor n=1 Tax=Flavobacterium sp. TaxID=239 RepID=UPI0026106041|nr:anti-sigma factor [Flavobacterium sp.]
MSTHNLNQLFENQNNWDFEEPETGHEKRFLEKLNKQKPSKKKKLNWIPLSIAASLLLGFGIILFLVNNPTTEEVVLSPQVQETHDYFSSVIRNELTQLKNQETPQSKALITDAMKELESLEDDYHNLKVEIANNGENKQIVFAMLTNLQTRISFIKTVLEQVEEINNLNTLDDEKHI